MPSLISQAPGSTGTKENSALKLGKETIVTEHFPLMVPGADSPTPSMKVFSPYDNRLLATVATADAQCVDRALARAYGLFQNRSAWLPPAKRIEILEKTAKLIEERQEELARGAAAEGGKPLIDSRVEVVRGIEGVKFCAESLRNQAGTVVPMGISAASMHRLAFTQREPIGVVVAVSAFNHPFNLVVHQVGPAVAAGCPVIVKPAGLTPLSCLRFVQLLREAGLPEEWCQVVVSEDRAVAEQLVTDPRNAFFSFIGSARVGWMLRSKLAPGTRCALEHGGVAPVIVAADADLDQAVPLLLKGGFYHSGQVCVSVQRVFADASIVDRLASRLAEAASALKVGDPTDEKTEAGPLIRPKEVDRVQEWVKEAVTGGAKLLCGGKQLENNCYAPTVLLNPPANATISTSEVFGPVVCLYSYDNLKDAFDQANSLDYAFQAAVFTKDIDTAMKAYRALAASAVMINDHTAFRVDWMPFAGLRHSGYGVGGIGYTFDEMQIEKLMVLRSEEL